MDPLIACTVTLSSPDRFDPAIVSDRTGLAMSQGGSAGEPRISPSGVVAPNPLRRSWWTHRIDHQRTFDMDGVLSQMLDRIEAVRDPFVSVRSGLEAESWISLHVKMDDGVTPDGTVSYRALTRLVTLGLALDLDLYCSQ